MTPATRVDSSSPNDFLRIAALAALLIASLPAHAAGKAKAARAAVAPKAAHAAPKVWTTPEFVDAAQKLDTSTRALAAANPARADGYTYGMDIAPLLLYAAERKDEALYTSLLPVALKLIVTSDDAALDGYVLWRHKDGADPEITGAEETLWMGRALWTGARAFNRADDRALAAKVVAGYARHAREQEGVWAIGKYYSFAGKSVSGLSVLGDYQADFVSDAELAAPAARGFGQKSYTVIQRAVAPSHLLLPLIQPELGEHFAGMGAQRYAPNDVVVLEDSCLGAEGAQRGLPDIAKGVLAFAGSPERLDKNGRLYAYYERRSGRPVGDKVLGSSGYACLARIAANFNDRDAASALMQPLTGDMLSLVEPGATAPLYSAGPLLRAAAALHAFQ